MCEQESHLQNGPCGAEEEVVAVEEVGLVVGGKPYCWTASCVVSTRKFPYQSCSQTLTVAGGGLRTQIHHLHQLKEQEEEESSGLSRCLLHCSLVAG